LLSLIGRLLDDQKWPTYTKTNALPDLGRIAQEAFQRDTFDGYLSYVLISHQLNEDYAILLLKESQFALRLFAVPDGFGWPTAAYEKPGSREFDMFGRIMQRIANSLDFNKKSEFLEACRKQSEIRNRLAHRLIDGLSLGEMRALAHEYKKGKEEMIDCFNDADDQFSWFFTMQILDTRWLDAILVQINSAENPSDKKKWTAVLRRFHEKFEQTWRIPSDFWRESNGSVLRRWQDAMGLIQGRELKDESDPEPTIEL
jgi:hypothetical protein